MKDEFDAKMLGRVGSGQLTEAKSLKRTVHWHEQEMCVSWAGGTRYVTELAFFLQKFTLFFFYFSCCLYLYQRRVDFSLRVARLAQSRARCVSGPCISCFLLFCACDSLS